MAYDVRQRLANRGHDLRPDRRRHHGVDRADAVQSRPEAEWFGVLRDQCRQVAAQRARLGLAAAARRSRRGGRGSSVSMSSTARLSRSWCSGRTSRCIPCSWRPVANSRWITRSCRSRAIRSRSSRTASRPRSRCAWARSSASVAWSANIRDQIRAVADRGSQRLADRRRRAGRRCRSCRWATARSSSAPSVARSGNVGESTGVLERARPGPRSPPAHRCSRIVGHHREVGGHAGDRGSAGTRRARRPRVDDQVIVLGAAGPRRPRDRTPRGPRVGDQLQRLFGVELTEHQLGDLGGDLVPASAALGVGVQPGVVDHHAGRGRERGDGRARRPR